MKLNIMVLFNYCWALIRIISAPAFLSYDFRHYSAGVLVTQFFSFNDFRALLRTISALSFQYCR